jgi:nucleotide-binding universal stress UspA family protein
MKVLVPMDATSAALAPLRHIEWLRRAGVAMEVVLLNAQPRFDRCTAHYTARAARAALRAERSAAAMAGAMEAMSLADIPFRAVAEVGPPAERIAAVAEREAVDEIMIGVGRHAPWLRLVRPSIAQGVIARTDIPVTVFARGRAGALERYGLPSGLAALAALLFAAD